METGIYMSSFAATVFIAGLVTVGVSLMTLLITLTVMLQSCQNKNSGVVQSLQSSKSTYSYHYCLAFAMHMELNNLDSDSFPEICKDAAIQYIKEGQYMKDLNVTMQLAENYFSTIKPLEDGRDVVLMDVDDFLPEDLLYPNLSFHQLSYVLLILTSFLSVHHYLLFLMSSFFRQCLLSKVKLIVPIFWQIPRTWLHWLYRRVCEIPKACFCPKIVHETSSQRVAIGFAIKEAWEFTKCHNRISSFIRMQWLVITNYEVFPLQDIN